MARSRMRKNCTDDVMQILDTLWKRTHNIAWSDGSDRTAREATSAIGGTNDRSTMNLPAVIAIRKNACGLYTVAGQMQRQIEGCCMG